MQLVLAPFVLVGAFSSGTSPSSAWILPFLAVHLGLYGGATAYNSFYDRDTGPIGFMKRPRPVPLGVRDAAVALQIGSVLILGWVHPAAGVIAGTMFLMGIAYSHPRWRWKRSTVGGLLAVTLGQGSGAVYLGFYAMGGKGWPGPLTHWVALGAAVMVAGLYPVTQVYQIAEDRARGDITLPVRLGWRRTLLASGLATTAGLGVLSLALGPQLPGPARVVMLVGPGALALVFWLWGRRFDRQGPDRNHDWAMAVSGGASLAFWGILVVGFLSR